MAVTPPDLAAYLARLGLTAPPPLSADGLGRLVAAHRQAIAFENLDILLGRPIRIDGPAVFAKLVTARRGGYCFEQNRLFADMLGALGLPVRPLLARVRLAGPPGYVPPRTHVLLLTALGESPWIVDAGFGGASLPPLPLRDGATARTDDGATHRLTRRAAEDDPLAGEWLLERAGPHAATDGRAPPHEHWQAQYSFDLAPVAPEDLDQCNHWTSTRPETRFTTLHVISRVLPGGFAALTDRQLSVYDRGKAARREVATADDYACTLTELFGLELPPADLANLPLFAGR